MTEQAFCLECLSHRAERKSAKSAMRPVSIKVSHFFVLTEKIENAESVPVRILSIYGIHKCAVVTESGEIFLQNT